MVFYSGPTLRWGLHCSEPWLGMAIACVDRACRFEVGEVVI